MKDGSDAICVRVFCYGSGKEVVKRIELCYTKYITKEMIESYNHLPVRIFF